MSFIRKAFQELTKRFDKRALQHDIDTHRLFLLTEYHARLTAGLTMDEDQIASISKQAEDLEITVRTTNHLPPAFMRKEERALRKEHRPRGMRRELAQHLHRQVALVTHQLDILICGKDSQNLAEEPTVMPLEPPRDDSVTTPERAPRQRGLWGAATSRANSGSAGARQVSPESLQQEDALESEQMSCRGTSSVGSGISMSALSAAFQDRHGFSLTLAPSAIEHPRAGIGVWLQGHASAGTVIGFYPGIVYTKAHYRDMPGYPKVDRQSDYLIARYDGAILDAKPWGRGAQEPVQTAQSLNYTEQQAMVLQQFLRKERRNPLALGHFANHPPPGKHPNALVAAYEFPAGSTGPSKHLQRYIPAVMFSHDSQAQGVGASGIPEARSTHILCLLLVASRDIENEELLLNYRLSPGAERPDWYAPVDPAEEKRRWA